ncbi:MAG: ABC transporter ATP-binding protein [Candidatus Woykebacteria bacterium GWB1_45_5]|uniref:ABC transporter ATP-binding protein n=2 Tax=Candidatus Woykeibacteriota TaxID=1817899 RepID=A0A1G1W510_9BACT|nr:MAG: ABC transporter ATP-binding protein [Candidatus Woykebacteria bacterium GWA1_44_8]OGY22803.1 MAG: ABC transporter ATP-binding protein [Candidatus Woykebacteria bacterium GWB1_45_5]
MSEVIVETKDLHKYYELGKENMVKALQGVSLQIKKGEFIAIIGPSGSGKSTLMHIFGALDSPTEGQVWLDGEEISKKKISGLYKIRGRKVGFIFQGFNLIPTMTALENVMLAVEYSGRKANAKREAAEILTEVGLEKRLGHKPSELSGGEQQRVAIARALVNKPTIVLADEPTGELDTQTSLEIIRLLKDLNEKEGQTFVIVTHNPEVANVCSRIIHLRDGKIEN